MARRTGRAPSRRLQTGGSGSRAASAVLLLCRTTLPPGPGRGARVRRQARGLCALLRPSSLPDRRPRCRRTALAGTARRGARISDAGPAPPGLPGRCTRRPAASPASTGIPGRSPRRTGPTGPSASTAGPLRQDLSRVRLDPAPGLGILAAYTINELPDDLRSAWLTRLLDAHARGATVLIIEPIARRMAPWWRGWEERFVAAGGRTDEWRFDALLPRRQRELARSAGLNPRELRARSLFAG